MLKSAEQPTKYYSSALYTHLAYFQYEDKPQDATMFLMVGGGVLLSANILKIIAYLTPCTKDDKVADIITPILDIAYFIVVIWGSVRVFGK